MAGGAIALIATGVGSAAAAGAFDNRTFDYVTKPTPGSAALYVPVLSGGDARQFAKLSWALIGSQDANSHTVYASISPLCSKVEGATVRYSVAKVAVEFYGVKVASCTPSSLPPREYAVKLPESTAGRTISGMTLK